jgi:8-oxo-dGTP pyrophosphatase MutT (NUDIX family)
VAEATGKDTAPAESKWMLAPATIHCVGSMILRRSKILLGLRAGHKKLAPNTWDIFGGHIEAGETWEDTLVRELQEELDINATSYGYVAACDESDPSKNWPKTTSHIPGRSVGWSWSKIVRG